MKKILLFLQLALILTTPAYATTYYVDCAGSDSNNGLSEATAFRTTQPVEGTGFLQPGDIVNIKKGCTWTGTDARFSVNSAGSAANPIIIQAYGASGADPIFDGSVDPAVDVPGWSGWTIHDATNSIYVSNVTVPWQVNTVIIDGSSTLSSPFHAVQNLTLLTAIPGKFYQSNSGAKVFVRLADNSNPNSHTIRFGRYAGDNDRGLVQVNNSTAQHIEFHDIHVKGSNIYNFSSANPYVSFIDCTAEFAARENFYFIDNVTNHPSGAIHNVCNRCTAKWASSWGHSSTGGAGQNITIEASYVDILNSEVAYGHMAGIDFLRYNSDTNPGFGRVINCNVHDNSQRSKTTHDAVGFDAEIYVDGGHDIQIINNTIYKTSGFSGGNGAAAISLGTEYAGTFVVDNVDIINNLVTGMNGPAVTTISLLHGSPVTTGVLSNIRMVGNTFVRGSYYIILSLGHMISVANGGEGVYSYNNIFYNPAGSIIGYMPSSSGLIHSDNNIYYTLDGENDILNDTYSLPEWQALTGQDANSLFVDPQFVSGHHLKNTLAGDATTSPGVNAGREGVLDSSYTIASIGSTRKDDVADEVTNIDIGYHYNFVLDSSLNFVDTTSNVSYENVIIQNLILR